MFTGIIEETGLVTKIEKKKNLYILSLKISKIHKGIQIGDSVSIDGVCLTVVKKKGDALSFDVMKETLRKTVMGKYHPGDKVNLERALKANSRLGGHVVSGHIDTVGILRRIKNFPNYVEWQIEIKKGLRRFVVPKGSIAVDGVSLTVGDVKGKIFSVFLIPHTLKVTTLGQSKKGSRLNIETDILAKYFLNAKKFK